MVALSGHGIHEDEIRASLTAQLVHVELILRQVPPPEHVQYEVKYPFDTALEPHETHILVLFRYYS